MSGSPDKLNVILLIGPTGSGKTPLGRLLEKRGFGGRRCLHFDFGGSLRRCAGNPGFLTPAEMRVVKHSLETGSLLEDRHFGIALKLLNAFLEERRADDNTLIVLNGLPRHTGQAVALESYIDIRLIVNFECSPETARERIRLNAGGDRAGRSDDTPEEIRKRADIFLERTGPLLEHYKRLCVPVIEVAIEAETTAEDTYERVTGEARRDQA